MFHVLHPLHRSILSIASNLTCVGWSTLMISSVNLLTDGITPYYVRHYAVLATNISFQVMRFRPPCA
jgi:hypothetical protein